MMVNADPLLVEAVEEWTPPSRIVLSVLAPYQDQILLVQLAFEVEVVQQKDRQILWLEKEGTSGKVELVRLETSS